MWCGSSLSRLSRNWIAQIHDESEDAAAYSPVRRVSDKLRRTGAMRCGMAMAKGAGIFARSIIRRAAVFSGLARRGGISGARCARCNGHRHAFREVRGHGQACAILGTVGTERYCLPESDGLRSCIAPQRCLGTASKWLSKCTSGVWSHAGRGGDYDGSRSGRSRRSALVFREPPTEPTPWFTRLEAQLFIRRQRARARMRRLLFMTLRRARLPLLLKPKRAFFQRYFARQAGSRLGWAFPIMPVIGASKRLN